MQTKVKSTVEVKIKVYHMQYPMLTIKFSQNFSWFTVMSLLEAPSLIEEPPQVSAQCHGIVAPPQK